MTTRTEVTLDGRLVVEGRMRHVFVDATTREKRPIPDYVRRGLEPYADEDGADEDEPVGASRAPDAPAP